VPVGGGSNVKAVFEKLTQLMLAEDKVARERHLVIIRGGDKCRKEP